MPDSLHTFPTTLNKNMSECLQLTCIYEPMNGRPVTHRLGENSLLVNETSLGVFRQLMAPGAWIVTGPRSRCYIIQKIFSKKYFLYPPKIRSAIENINYFHISGNFLATYTLYIVTHALLAYSPQRLARYYGVRHRVVSANSREMSPVVLKWLLYKLLG